MYFNYVFLTEAPNYRAYDKKACKDDEKDDENLKTKKVASLKECALLCDKWVSCHAIIVLKTFLTEKSHTAFQLIILLFFNHTTHVQDHISYTDKNHASFA